MKRTAHEIIRSLELRVARLEKKSSHTTYKVSPVRPRLKKYLEKKLKSILSESGYGEDSFEGIDRVFLEWDLGNSWDADNYFAIGVDSGADTFRLILDEHTPSDFGDIDPYDGDPRGPIDWTPKKVDQAKLMAALEEYDNDLWEI